MRISRTMAMTGILLLCLICYADAQNINMEQIRAEEEFRWGVLACNMGRYNEAITAFQRSISYDPERSITREWLGRAYYFSGFEETALKIWNELIEMEEAGPDLREFVTTVSARRGLGAELRTEERFVIRNEVPGMLENAMRFQRPVSVRPLEDGSYFVVGYANNIIYRFDINGRIQSTIRGGLEGFNHPFDIIQVDDEQYFVSEFRGDRIAQCNSRGDKVRTFGEEGTGDGALLGPQYLAADGKGYIYVSDFGNRRVSKFDLDGNFVLSFGKANGTYPGFLTPSGIVVDNGMVYVADTERGHIAVFDESGNYLSRLGEGALQAPEGLSLLPNGNILVSDKKRLVSLNIENDSIKVLSDFEGRARNIMMSVPDVNGNILSVDFDANSVFVLSELASMLGGFHIQIRHIDSTDFPSLRLDVTVEDNYGNPVVGLTESNFLINEQDSRQFRIVEDFNLNFIGQEDENPEFVILAERSREMLEERNSLRRAVQGLFQAGGANSEIRVVSAAETPVLEARPGSGILELAEAAALGGGTEAFSKDWSFDLGLRFAAAELIPGGGRRAVAFISSGILPDSAFEDFGLLELAQFLENNGIVFYTVYTKPHSGSEELEYLVRETGGRSIYLYNPRGMQEIQDHINTIPNGDYQLTYSSSVYSNFGRDYIRLELEAFVEKLSGRSVRGYYAPLEF